MIRHGFQMLPVRGIRCIDRRSCPAVIHKAVPVPVVVLDRNATVYDDILFHGVFSAAAHQETVFAYPDDQVAVCGLSGVTVVPVDSVRMESVCTDPFQTVIPQDTSVGAPVVPCIDGTGIAGHQYHIVDIVIFHDMFVAAVHNGGVGRVADFTVVTGIAHTGQADTGLIRLVYFREIMDIAVGDTVVPGGQGLPVTAADIDTAFTGVGHFTGVHQIVPAVHHHGITGDILHQNLFKEHVLSVALNPIAHGAAQGQIPEGHVFRIFTGNQRLFMTIEVNTFRIIGRIKIHLPGFPVKIPFIHGIQFFRYIV